MTTAPSIPLSRHLLRVRDLIDRAYAGPLDIPALARSAHVSESHFARSFKSAFGETPHRYLLRRRMERAKALLRADELSVTEVCLEVGFTSLGSFSTQFRRFVGESPTAYREREGHAALSRVPGCLVKRYTRPSDRETARDERTLDPSRRSTKPRDRAREVATGGSRSG